MSKLLYSAPEAAEDTGLSEVVIKAAIKQSYSSAKERDLTRLPRLPAKLAGGNAYRILATDLQAWLEQLPDA